jgi:hypothetical protein
MGPMRTKATAKRRFVPTHELTVTRAADRLVFEVMLVERGLAFERDEWEAAGAAGWLRTRRGWRRARDGVSPPVTARRLGRGSDPKRGSPGRNRTIRCPDDVWELFRAAAAARGISVADFLIGAAEDRIDKSNAEALRKNRR